ncbi:MAG: ribosome-associated translation inhibitor RaiA [Flavobacteriaceae bacterium]|nr:ribosome-associated translation inhibitor RaiA [Flavobacteriaceae bacterium]
MKIYMQAIGFSAGESLEEYLTEKLEKLDTFYDQIIAANVIFKLDNNNSKDNKIVDIKLEVPGDDILVTKQGEAFPEVVDIAVDTLKRLIIKKKEKISKA